MGGPPVLMAGLAAKVSDLGGNVDAATSCLGVAPNAASKANAVLNLGALADNGGTTLTMLPGPGSDAIDRGIDAACAAASIDGIDQRGYPRPQGAHCDAGAVEVQPCYVKRDAAGANDGTSWIDAYTDLQSALEARRLERDFGVGLDAAALILDLQHEVRRLKAVIRAHGLR